MNEIEKAIDLHNKYTEKFLSGFLNGSFEDGLTASISLSDSSISIPGISEDFPEELDECMNYIEKIHKEYGDIVFRDYNFVKKHPQLKKCFSNFELWRHEAFHGVQKHAYRSVFTLVDSIQSIESWELKLFFSHVSSGGKWRLGETFLSLLREMDASMIDRVSELIARDCRIALEAISERDNGIGILHLIEGQAFIASRLSIGLLDALPTPNASIYTKAWSLFIEKGGRDPVVFIILVGSALRYGNINDDPDSVFKDFYPHPVDIFNFIINFSANFEEIFEKIQRNSESKFNSHASEFSHRAPGIFAPERQNFRDLLGFKDKRNFHDSSVESLLETILKSGIKPVDSPIDATSYVKKDTDEEFENPDDEYEYQEIKERHHMNAQSAFDKMEIDSPSSPEKEIVINAVLEFSKIASSVLENIYTRFSPSTKDDFIKDDLSKIADAVASDYSKKFPYYYTEEMIIRSIFDQNSINDLFGYFFAYISQSVSVTPFRSGPQVNHMEYSYLRLMPDAIKKFLIRYNWVASGSDRNDKTEQKYAPRPYCCKKHGLVPDSEDPSFIDNCNADDGIGVFVQTMFKRSLSDMFE